MVLIRRNTITYHQIGRAQRADLNKSNQAFVDLIWPKIHQNPNIHLLSLESDTSEIARALDIEAGIDFLAYEVGTGKIRGISSRVQWVDENPYNSFTIRTSRPTGYNTEIDKKHGDNSIYLMAGTTIQSYIRRRDYAVMSVGIIRTTDLFDFAEKHPENLVNKRNKDGSSNFVGIWWRDIIEAGTLMRVVK